MSAKAADIEVKTQERECKRCSKKFSSETLMIYGAPKLQVHHCEDCAKVLEEEQRQREQLAREEAEAAHMKEREAEWARLCPPEFRLPHEHDGATNLARLDACQPEWRRVMSWKPGPRGLLILGPTGTCKTRILWRLIRQQWDAGRRFAVLTAAEFDRECRDAAGSFRLSEWFNRLARAHVLAIDDLGKGCWTESTTSAFFDLVDKRTRDHCPIVATTNETGDSLADRIRREFAEPLVRRFRDYCDCVVLQ